MLIAINNDKKMLIIHDMFLFRYIDGGPPAGEPDMSSSIWRRYSEFELLRNYLVANFPAVRKQKQTCFQCSRVTQMGTFDK